MATPDQPAPMTWRLHREVVLLAGWGRAILLQLAHPLVAQGVADHSGFATDRRGHVKRLKRTLRAMLALTFGGPKGAAEAAAAINRIHDRVHGHLAEAAGSFSSGAHYSAHDPALLAWVHATLVDSFLLTYERFVAPLTPAERDRYCREAGAGGPLLGIPPGIVPGSVGELSAYMERMVARGEIAHGDEISLVGHSTGGLDIRCLLSELRGREEDIELHGRSEPFYVDGGSPVHARDLLLRWLGCLPWACCRRRFAKRTDSRGRRATSAGSPP